MGGTAPWLWPVSGKLRPALCSRLGEAGRGFSIQGGAEALHGQFRSWYQVRGQLQTTPPEAQATPRPSSPSPTNRDRQ